MIEMSCQAPVCKDEQNNCLNDFNIDLSVCSKNCEGLLITSYIRNENVAEIDEFAEKILKEYSEYKKYVPFPTSIKGMCKIIVND